MGKVKLVYRDGQTAKVLFGTIESEDSHFLNLLAEDNTFFRIGKSAIVSIKELHCPNGLSGQPEQVTTARMTSAPQERQKVAHYIKLSGRSKERSVPDGS